MSENKNATEYMNYDKANKFVTDFESVIGKPKKTKSSIYYCGVDLGTACVVVAVLDENRQPVAGRYQYASVVKDGMVVDYIGAIDIVKRMKKELEEELGEELLYAAAAIPPGTGSIDGGAVKNVVMASGFMLTNLLDESTAANAVLEIQNGAVVDIGGGTTGISIFKDGEVIFVDDEPTGGTHFSLVLAGAKKISFDEAELIKRDTANHQTIFPVLVPVIEKVASIIKKQIEGKDIDRVALVGGTACLGGIEDVIQKELGIQVDKPQNPLFVTPLGIALLCREEEYIAN
jgi:ethanolamine utilization protein EutJ